MARARRSREGPRSRRSPTGDAARARAKEVQPAYKSARSIIVFAAAAALGATADLLSKHFVFSALLGREGHRVTVLPGVLRLTLSTNPGIVFGIRLPGPLVPIATLAMVAVVILLFATSSRRFRGLHLGLGMVLGGALGNAYDRLLVSVRVPHEPLARTHQVRDFIDVYAIGYPIFNVADILLVVGVGLIILHMFRHRREPAA